MNFNIARWLNRGAQITAAVALSLLGFGLVQLVLGGSPALAKMAVAAPLAAPNDPPAISAIADQTTSEDAPIGPVTFYVSDTETAASALTVTISPANPALFGAIAQTNSGVTRTLTITPAANANGSSVVTVTVSDGISTTSAPFTLTVTAVNDAPTITAIADQTIAEDSATPVITFTVGDLESLPVSLTVTAATTNAALAPLSGIVFGGIGANRTVTVTPSPNASGVALITVQVSDSISTTSEPFTLTVTAVNDAPTITAIADQTIAEDGATSAITFTVGDLESLPVSLTVTAATTNAALAPLSGIVFGGSGANRTVTVTPSPNANGVAKITVQVSDGISTTSAPFTLTVTAVNDAPTITAIADQSVAEETPTPAITFTVGDPDVAAGSLTLSATTGDALIVPLSGIVFGGSGANRTVTVTPAPNATGSVLITVRVSDGTSTTSEPFTLTVTNVNDAPTISNIADQSTNEDTATGSIAFMVSDAETGGDIMAYSLSAANPALINSFVFGGSGNARTLVITPAANANGSSAITVTVSDGMATASDSFVLTVVALNDNPFFGSISPVTTNEDQNASFNFTIGDIDSNVVTSTVGTGFSNPSLVQSVTASPSGATRTLNIVLVANAFGTDVINLFLSDGNGGFASTQFNLTVNATNDAPTITAIGNQSMNEDTSLGPINFSVSDVLDSANPVLTVTATSTNAGVVANTGLVVSPATGGNGGRSLTITPVANASGATQITVMVHDGQATAQTTFLLTVNATNDPPTINAIASESTNEDTPKNVTVTFSDGDGDALTPSAVAGNATLLPNANLGFSGSGNSRTLTLTPAQNVNGSTLITVTVVDPSGAAAQTSFLLTVLPVNDPPTLDDLGQQSGLEDTPFSYSGVVVNDVDSPVNGLVLTATSSNPSVVPNVNISFSGAGANRTVSMTPQPNQSGLVVLTVYASDGQSSTSKILNVVFGPVNDAPTIGAIANQSTNEDTATGAIAFTVNDIDTVAGDLTIVSSSSNPTLVPASNITPGSSGANRTVTIMPAPDQFGTVVVSVVVQDGPLNATSRFTLTVNPVNDRPTISEVRGQFVTESLSSEVIPFTIGDLETTASALVVTAVSSNQNVIRNTGLVLGGSGPNRTLTITPVQFQNGTATVSLTVYDAENVAAVVQFVVTVDAVNDPPTITQIADVTIAEDSVMGPVSFQVNDVETPASQLAPTVTSSNPVLVPLSAIRILGSGVNRTIVITPLADNAGVSDITLTLVDSSITTRETFRLTVNSVNDAPKISPISPLSMTEDTITTTTFTVNDVDNSSSSLQVSAVSSNPTLVAITNDSFGGGGANRSITIAPALNQNGTATLTVTVSDGSLTDSTAFVVTVNAANDVPTISTIGDKVTNEDEATTPIGFTVNDVESPASSLEVTATSSNPALVPVSRIALSGSGSERLVTLTPLPDQNGSTTISVMVMDSNGATTNRDFVLVVNPVNDAPVIPAIRGKTILQSTFVTIPVTLSDVDNVASQLQLTGEIASSNPNLIPNNPSNFYFTGNTLSRLLTIVPTPGEIGTATVTVTVSDGSATHHTIFPVVVTPFNNAPTISAIPNQVINEDAVTAPIEFNVSDVELAPGDLEVVGAASNGTLIPANGILINSYGGPTRTVVITPMKDQWGSATITLSVNDGLSSDSKVFNLTVNSVDDPPFVSSVQTKTNSSVFLAGVASKPMTVTVGDSDTPLGNLQITILSSNAGIVAPGDVSINGTGITRTLVVKPKAGKSGTVTLTVQVSDGTTTALTSFVITVGVRLNLPLLYRNFAICDRTQTDCTEPNNLLTSATGPININTVYTGTVNGTSDRYDHYTITLEAEISYTFRVDFAVGDLDLYLYGSAFSSPPLVQSAKSGRPELFEYRPRVTAIYYILVYGFEEAIATNRRYTLLVRQTSSRTQLAAEGEGADWVEAVEPGGEALPLPEQPQELEEPRPDPQWSNPGEE